MGNNNKQNNYFTTMISRYNGNQDFITFLKPEQIQKSAKERIFREMARGQIDYSQFGNYYLDVKFLENLIVAANDEMIQANVISNALYYFDMQFPGDYTVSRIHARQENLKMIYYTIYTRLCNVKFSNDIGYLTDIQYVLKDISKNM